MYSAVLMLALSGSTEAVDFGHRCSCFCSGYYSTCHGCYGCYGCYGGVVSYGCHSCYGCYGGVVTYGCYGCHSCHGVVIYHGYTGCCGGTIVMPGKTMMDMKEAEKIKVPPKTEKKPEDSRAPAPATIVVSLPANATLTIDGNPTSSTSTTRTLISPALERDRTFVYTLQAEVDGQVQTQQVRVYAGQTSQAQFTFPSAGIASR